MSIQSQISAFFVRQPMHPASVLISKLPIVFLSFGALIRLVQYGFNRSLWADEAKLALNILDRSYAQLLQPLDYNQVAPIAFLWVEKSAVLLLGNHEYALRLFPLIAGLLALILFYGVARRSLTFVGLLTATILFASLQSLIYYTSEVKPYGVDVAVALLLYGVLMSLRRERLSTRQALIASGLGAASLWFSYPAIFVLVGMEASYVIPYVIDRLKTRRSIDLRQRLVPYLSWITSALIFYQVSLNRANDNPTLNSSWQEEFPSSLLDLDWPFYAFKSFFANPLGFSSVWIGLAIALFCMGCGSLYRRQFETLLSIAFILIATLGAAYLHQYPFYERLVLFLVPFFILILAEGVSFLCQFWRSRILTAIGITLSLLLIAAPLSAAISLLFQPYFREAIKPVLSYVQEHQQPGDELYVFEKSAYQFRYYARRYGYQPGEYILGANDLDSIVGEKLSNRETQRYRQDIDRLQGQARVWFLFSDVDLREEVKAMRSYLNKIGRKIDFYQSPGSSSFVYLYDLRR